jgi:sugar/nucleoside kinase (ribokinase family)
MISRSIAAIGQPIWDCIASSTDEALQQRGLERGSHAFVDGAELEALRSELGDSMLSESLGGSALNTIRAAARLGLEGYFVGLLGLDYLGQRVRQLLHDEGIQTPLELVAEHRTGVCVSIVNAAGERTMRTNLGAAAILSQEHLQGLSLPPHEWFILEGYLLGDGGRNQAALLSALERIAAGPSKIVVTLASEHIVSNRRAVLLDTILPQAYVVCGNEAEARALTGALDAESALDELSKIVPNAIVTCGDKGAWHQFAGLRFHVEAHGKEGAVVDSTGAGDIYLGAFIAGVSRGHHPHLAARGAALMASLVVRTHGAGLPEGARQLWETRLGSDKLD